MAAIPVATRCISTAVRRLDKIITKIPTGSINHAAVIVPKGTQCRNASSSSSTTPVENIPSVSRKINRIVHGRNANDLLTRRISPHEFRNTTINRYFSTEATPAPRAPTRRAASNTKPLLFGAACLGSAGLLYIAPDDSGDRLATFLDEADENSREFLEGIADKLVPKKEGPWLSDLKAMGYPEFWPTLVIDLDKVLCMLHYDRRYGWQVQKRPGADKFLEELQWYYELVIFSDEMAPVAQDVIQRWGTRSVMSILQRDFCYRKKGAYVKDMSQLGRKSDRIIQLDHDPEAMSLNPENGILIKPYDGDPDDRELEHLLEFLKHMASQHKDTDVREFIQEFGGGDEDIGKRFRIWKESQDAAASKKRGLLKAFGGGGFGTGGRSQQQRAF